MTYEINGQYLSARSVPETDLVRVTFHWTAEHGSCKQCGIPAAYDVAGQYRACCVCAAQAAADGETIQRLSNEDY